MSQGSDISHLKQAQLYESLSALIDNQCGELELHRILAESERDETVRARWQRYQMVRSLMKGEAIVPAASNIAESVRAAISELENPALNFKLPSQQQLQNELESAQTAAAAHQGWQGWRANLGRVGIAASVALVILLGVQQLNTTATDDSTLVAEQTGAPVAPIATAVNTNALPPVDLQTVSQRFNGAQQSRLPEYNIWYSPADHQQQLQNERMRSYIQLLMQQQAAQHAELESAAPAQEQPASAD